MRMMFLAMALAAGALAGPAAAGDCPGGCGYRETLEQGSDGRAAVEQERAAPASGERIACEGNCNVGPKDFRPEEPELEAGNPRVAACDLSCNFKPNDDRDADLVQSRRA